MDYRKLSRAELIDFATNTATAVADGKVTGFLVGQNTAFSDALTDAVAELAAAETNIVSLRAQSLEATEIGVAKAEKVLNILGNINSGMDSVDSPASEYDALGFDPPDTVRTFSTPETPTDLVAGAPVIGVNELKWKGNNPSRRVTFIIECATGDSGPFVMVGTTTTQKWRHEGVVRGEYYQYRVRAQAGRNLMSDYSNIAVVYGI